MAALTALSRFRQVMAGLIPDRAPVIPVLHTAAAELIGATVGDYAGSAQVMARTLVAAYRHYGLDGVQLTLGVATEASGLGCPIVEPPDGLPKVLAPVIREQADLEHMTAPDPWRDGLMPRFLEGLHLVTAEIGDEACVMGVIRGPMNIASQIRGIQDLMFDLIDSPGFAAELLRFCNRAALALGHAVMDAGAHVVVIGEAICSPAFISPAFYRTHVLERHADLIRDLKAYGQAAVLMHICGDVRPILPDIASAGPDIIDLDWQVSITEARRLAGPGIVLRGNLDPLAALHDGTPELVRRLAEKALCDADEAPPEEGRRFILSSGCDIAPGTPRENIAALVDAARRHPWQGS